MDRYTQRLLDEWRQHGKIVIAVDYDDTISPWKLYKTNEGMLKHAIEVIRAAQKVGAYVVVFSACAPDRHDEIKAYCEGVGIRVDSINTNPIELPYGKHGKVFANIYIDDRAGINEALKMLTDCTYVMLGDQNTDSTLTQKF